ncbi:uncharacterized protein LOC103312234 isoform X1 [Tribolium castaneum]
MNILRNFTILVSSETRAIQESMDPQQPNSDDEDFLNVSAGSNPPSGKPDKMLGTSDFISLLGTRDDSYYIDKTTLLEVFLKCGRSRVLLTAPRRFGKTINLLMLKTCFELQVPPEEYKMLSEDEFQIKVKETANYKLFEELQLEITKNPDLMNKHFGKYPTLHISFKCDMPIASFSDGVAFCCGILSKAFKKHKYLISEKALSQSDKNIYAKWLNPADWDERKAMDRRLISDGLQTLVYYVFESFNKKVVLLIDEYDSVIMQAILFIKAKDELAKIIQFYLGIIQAAVKNEIEQHIEYAFITGISHISGMGLSGSNIKPFRFLENHSFVPYYGLTVMEIRNLLRKTYQFDDQRIAEAEKKFNGYSTVCGVKIYNIWSVLEHASRTQEEHFIYDWQDTGYIVGLEKALRFPTIMKIIQTELLLYKPIEIKKSKTLVLEDILQLVEIIGNVDPQNVEFPRYDLFFSFLVEQGYLSFVANKSGLLVIPNEQIKEKIEEKITDSNIKVFNRNSIPTEDCREFFLKISERDCDYDDFKIFHTSLEDVLQNYAAKWIKKNEENIRCTIKILISTLKFKDSAELNFNFTENGVKHSRRIDVVIIKDSFLMLIETKYKESSKKAMLDMRDRNYLKVLEDKDVIRNTITRFVLMGINMDENGQVSISYLQNNHNFDAMTLIP